jgi:hypothetical protein
MRATKAGFQALGVGQETAGTFVITAAGERSGASSAVPHRAIPGFPEAALLVGPKAPPPSV